MFYQKFIFLLCIFFSTGSFAASVAIPVASDNDDIEENLSSGNMSVNSSDLELAYDGGTGQTVGMRFLNVTIPAKAHINSAHISFDNDRNRSGTTNLVIYGQDADTAGAISTTAFTFTNMTRTKFSSTWAPAPWTVVHALYNSADFADVIKEIVDRPGWSSGNNIIILIDPGSGCIDSNCRREAESAANLARAPILNIDYTAADSVKPNYLSADNSCANPKNIILEFSEAIDPTTGGTASNYTVDGITPASAVVQADQSSVLLTMTTGLANNASISLGISNIEDLSSNIITTISTSFSTPDCGALSSGIRVNTNSDDAEDSGATSSDIDIGQKYSGTIFRNIEIPTDATITNAYVEFTARGNTTAGTTTTIFGEQDINPTTFGVGNLPDVGNHTTASVDWTINNWTSDEVGTDTQTPNIKDIVQEIIELPGWVSGSDINILFADTSGLRAAHSHESDSTKAALLHIEYSLLLTLKKAESSSTCSPRDEITLTFSHDLDAITATNTANYSVDNGVTVSTATLVGTKQVKLTTTTNLPDAVTITVTVNNIQNTDGSTIAPGSTASFYQNCSAIGINIRVNTSSDDAEAGDGVGSSDIDIGQKYSGTIFRNIPIPVLASITNAYVEFNPRRTNTGATSATIFGEKTINPTTYSAGYLPDVGNHTTATTSWSSIPAWTTDVVGADTQTPNIKDIVQEIVDLPSWVSGSDIDILYENLGGARQARSYDNDPTKAALLHIEYNLINPPKVVSVSGSCVSLNQVTIVFNEDVENTTATNTANYTIDGGLTITGAIRSPNNTVTLTLDNDLTDLTSYTVTVVNVEDLTADAISPAISTTFTQNCSNMVAYYKLDEASWNGTTDEVLDSSGNNLHGTSIGGIASTQAKVCNGASFDGLTAAVVEVADNALLDISDELTVVTWIKANSLPASGLKSVVSKDENFEFHINTTGKVFWWWQTSTLTSATSISVGTWHHIAIVYSKSAASQKIYIDGVLDANTNTRNESMITNTDPLQIGGDMGFVTREFDGLIDEVKIFAQALTATQISEDMAKTHICEEALACSFRDNFSSVAYSNNDGDQLWASNWVETNDDGIVTTGDAYMNAGSLVLTNQGGGALPKIHRELDLTGATSATLDFTFTTGTGVDNTDRFDVEASGNGGGSWTLLERIGSLSGEHTVTKSYDITSYIAANTQIRLAIQNRYNNTNELVKFSYVAVHPEGLCGGNLDHFNINIGGSPASTCATKSIVISARDPTDAIVTDYIGAPSITTSTSHGNFAINTGNGTLNPDPDNDDNGAVTSYTFDLTDAGQMTIDLDNAHADNLFITVNDSVDSISTSSATINFRNNAFVITEDSIQVAGKPQAMTATVVRRDPSTGDCGTATAYNNGTQPIKASITRTAELPSALAPTINAVSLPNAEPASTNINLNFISGVASFNLDTTDVGQYSLTLLDDSRVFATGDDIAGSSATITTRPFGFDIDFSDDRATNGITGDSYSIDGNTNVSGFATAGNDINMEVTGVLWESGDDADVDGTPDSGANLTNNTTTPNFGKEATLPSITYAYVLNGVANSGSLTVANTASTGSMNTAGSVALPYTNIEFSNGATTTTTINWSEVGIIDINADLTSYLAIAGQDITGTVSNVGRFSPNGFTVAVASDGAFENTITDATAFTYIGQDFSYSSDPQFTITAVNVSGGTTQNYGGTFVKLDKSEITLNYPNQDATTNDSTASLISLTKTIDPLAHTLTVNGNGTLSLTLDSGTGVADQFSFDRTNGQITPFTADLSIDLTAISETTDSANYAGTTPTATFGNLNRYGRAFLSDAYNIAAFNSVVNPSLKLQYFDGADFVSNTDDLSTTLSDTSLTCSSSSDLACTGAIDGTGDNVQITAPATITPNNSFTITDIDATGSLTGSVTITSAFSSHLQFDWDDDSTDDATVDSIIGFYLIRGDNRFLYWNEAESP